MKPTLLTLEARQQALDGLPSGWHIAANELVRTFQFGSYLEGIEFVRQAGGAAEAMDHHPDMEVGWRKVTVRLSTHSAGGLTALDFDLAQKISTVAGLR